MDILSTPKHILEYFAGKWVVFSFVYITLDTIDKYSDVVHLEQLLGVAPTPKAGWNTFLYPILNWSCISERRNTPCYFQKSASLTSRLASRWQHRWATLWVVSTQSNKLCLAKSMKNMGLCLCMLVCIWDFKLVLSTKITKFYYGIANWLLELFFKFSQNSSCLLKFFFLSFEVF